MFVDRKVKKTVTETVRDYYAEQGDIIKIPGHSGLWVVEEARMTGGGRAHNDYYPDAWHVTARKLNYVAPSSDGPVYDPNNQTITFTQHTLAFNNVIEGVQPKGRMRMTYVFEDWGIPYED
jgi:hypothetical protein